MRARASPLPAKAALASKPAPGTSQLSLDSGRQPLYASLAQALTRDIAQKRYPVGGLLPTEDAIASRYGVSRHTVRQALRELK
ncbi:MAG: GntR family transcriptional regulator, partial [Gammaproteobacteria bacterium]|nr:GntR family transcriptional regulator [Gammaproteobacteria bacterium]